MKKQLAVLTCAILILSASLLGCTNVFDVPQTSSTNASSADTSSVDSAVSSSAVTTNETSIMDTSTAQLTPAKYDSGNNTLSYFTVSGMADQGVQDKANQLIQNYIQIGVTKYGSNATLTGLVTVKAQTSKMISLLYTWNISGSTVDGMPSSYYYALNIDLTTGGQYLLDAAQQDNLLTQLSNKNYAVGLSNVSMDPTLAASAVGQKNDAITAAMQSYIASETGSGAMKTDITRADAPLGSFSPQVYTFYAGDTIGLIMQMPQGSVINQGVVLVPVSSVIK